MDGQRFTREACGSLHIFNTHSLLAGRNKQDAPSSEGKNIPWLIEPESSIFLSDDEFVLLLSYILERSVLGPFFTTNKTHNRRILLDLIFIDIRYKMVAVLLLLIIITRASKQNLEMDAVKRERKKP